MKTHTIHVTRYTIHMLTYLLLVSCFLFLAPKTLAQTKTTIGITPSIINITLSPGKIYSYVVSVKNLSKVPIPISARIDTFTDLDGSKNYSVNSLSKWLKISPSDSIILPGTTKKFNLTVTIPKSITLGGYYASISFTPLSPRTIKKDTQVRSQIVILALANIGAPRAVTENAEISGWKMNMFLTSKELKDTTISVKNLSLYHFGAKPIFNFRPIIGSHKQYIIDEKIILPGRERTWDHTSKLDQIPMGIYNVNLSVSVGEGVSISRNKIVFVLPSYNVIVLICMIIIIMLIFSLRKKIHVGQAFKAMVDKN